MHLLYHEIFNESSSALRLFSSPDSGDSSSSKKIVQVKFDHFLSWVRLIKITTFVFKKKNRTDGFLTRPWHFTHYLTVDRKDGRLFASVILRAAILGNQSYRILYASFIAAILVSRCEIVGQYLTYVTSLIKGQVYYDLFFKLKYFVF